MVDLIGECGGAGLGSGGIAKDVEVAKVDLLDKFGGLVEFGIGFARESDDHIGAEGKIADGGACFGDDLAKCLFAGAAEHAFEGLIAARLKGKMEVAAKAGILPEIEELRRKIPRFERREAKARGGRLIEDGLEKVFEIEVGVALIAAISAEMNACQDDLFVAEFQKSPNLREDLSQWATALLATSDLCHAKRALVVASVLDFDVSAGASEISGFEIAGDRFFVERFGFDAHHKISEFFFVEVSDNVPNTGDLCDFLFFDLAVAACDDNPRMRGFSVGLVDHLAGLATCFVGHSTSVDHAQVGVFGFFGEVVSNTSECPTDLFDLTFVESAAQGV